MSSSSTANRWRSWVSDRSGVLRRSLAAVVVGSGSFAAGACGGARVPDPGAGNSARCIVGATAGTRDEVSDALAAVDAIYKNLDFWALVSKRTWLASPTGPSPLSGQDVAAVLSHVEPAQRGYAITHIGWSKVPFIHGKTIASTVVCGNVTVDVKHVQALEMLVDTIAHENTHVAGTGPGLIGCDSDAGTDYRYTDGDYDDATKVWLVSYTTGDMAECFYLDHQQGSSWTFDDCMAHIIDGQLNRGYDRRHTECCACGKSCDEEAILKAVRSASGTCSGVTCDACRACPSH